MHSRIASRLEVTPATAGPTKASHTRIVQRVVEKSEYVLVVLHRMRAEVSANPELFDPDAQERINEAIARMEDVLRSARLELMTCSVEQNAKAA
jgi:hypothetical protein